MSDPVEVAAEAIRNQGGFTDDKYEHGWSTGYARAAILAFLKACESEAGQATVARAIWDVNGYTTGEDADPFKPYQWQTMLDDEGEYAPTAELHLRYARAVLRALADLAGGGT